MERYKDLNVGSFNLNSKYSFDPAGRIAQQQVSSDTQELTRFDYDYCEWSGSISSISNATLTTGYSSDILDRVTNITHRTADGTAVHSFAYAYDAANLITQQVSVADEQAVTNRYAYDGLGRLITTNDISYTYDLAGNRLSAGAATYTYTHNRLDGVSHDAAGNVTNMVRDGVTLSFVWNSQHQLVSVSTNNVLAESYQYDTTSRRISTTKLTTDHHSPATEYHIYDGDECIADLDASGNPLRTYVWGSGIDNLLAMTVFNSNATNTYYAVKDHLGSVHALVDAYGEVVESYQFDAWGNVLGVKNDAGQVLSASTLGNRYLFQGREYSFTTGLYNFRARWYDPVTGRWLSNDPIGISGGLNLYEFCGSNPVNFRDPWGLAAPNVIAGLIGGGVGSAIGGVMGGMQNGWRGAFTGAIAGFAGGFVTGFSLGLVSPAITGIGSGALLSAGAGALGGASSGIVSEALKPKSEDICEQSFEWGHVGHSALLGGLGGGLLGGLSAGLSGAITPIESGLISADIEIWTTVFQK